MHTTTVGLGCKCGQKPWRMFILTPGHRLTVIRGMTLAADSNRVRPDRFDKASGAAADNEPKTPKPPKSPANRLRSVQRTCAVRRVEHSEIIKLPYDEGPSQSMSTTTVAALATTTPMEAAEPRTA